MEDMIEQLILISTRGQQHLAKITAQTLGLIAKYFCYSWVARKLRGYTANAWVFINSNKPVKIKSTVFLYVYNIYMQVGVIFVSVTHSDRL